MKKLRVGQRVKGILIMNNISQSELAEYLDISDASLSDKLNCKTKFDIETELIPIIKYINRKIPKNKRIDPNYVLGW